MNKRISISLNESSSTYDQVNISGCMNLLMSLSGSKNRNICECNCVCEREPQ